MQREPLHFQILDVGSIWIKEFASALARLAPVVAWSPVMMKLGVFHDWERTERIKNPPLEIVHYPLQRGYARTLLGQSLSFEHKLLKRLHARCDDAERSTLICTTPFYAPVAERWPGPVIYYVTDLTAAYKGLVRSQVTELDRRLCRIAKTVCPNSYRIADYLTSTAGCDPDKITVVANATRESNLASRPLHRSGPLPADLADMQRPLIGVLGNLAANMDWELLAHTVQMTPEFSWVFVGPTNMRIADPAQSEARRWVMAHARFTGSKPYGELQEYARSLDAAVLPYRKAEPTYSGSSTRFYEHLAACRPMIATRGFAELLEKQPLVELVDTAAELAASLRRLESLNFHDGLETARWQASRSGTWEERASKVLGLCHALKDGGSGSAVTSLGQVQAPS